MDLRSKVLAMVEAHWQAGGFTVPNSQVYPWLWLWDSCFHALIWAELGREDRALTELSTALGSQAPDGFVPHMRYLGQPDFQSQFWGREGSSSITQPPMFGHAIAELTRRGIAVPDELVARAHAAMRFLLVDRARSDDGLICAVHPWETGCDDSPRWDDWCGPGGWSESRWYEVKGELLATVVRSRHGSPLSNPAFDVAPAGFNALVAFNAAELGYPDETHQLTEALERRWDPDLATWVDGEHESGRVRTVDSLLPILLETSHRGSALAELAGAGFAGKFGPPAVHRDEPCFDSAAYWRGPAWPQLNYLLALAGAPIGQRLIAGATKSGLAEYWHPDTGEGLGAIPQSWAGLALLMNARAENAL